MKLRALTWNVHKCVGGVDRRYDSQRVADVIGHHDPDIVMLQEVAQNSARYQGEQQCERLAELLGYRHSTYFVNVKTRDHRGEYGNAILSRFPLTQTSNVSLKIPGKKMRSVLHARLRVSDGRRRRTLHVFNMHLGLSGIERKIQLRRFLEARPFKGLDERTPILVGGDFNDVWGTLGKLLEPAGFRGPSQPIATFPAFAPVRALDSIFVRGVLRIARLDRSRMKLARQASDHLPLIADLESRPKRKSR